MRRFCPLPFALLILFELLTSCHPNRTGEADSVNNPLPEQRELAEKYCGSCHLSPSPALLDKSTWRDHVLPAMAKRLGLEVWQKTNYFQNAKSAISLADWTDIVSYYDSLAPKSLPAAKGSPRLTADWSVFSLHKPTGKFDQTSTTTMVAIDSANHEIFTSDSEKGGLYKWNAGLGQIGFKKLPSPAVQIIFQKDNKQVITCMGVMKAVDIPAGKLIRTKANDFEILASNLIRPIHTATADFDRDGLADYAVCNFGHNLGGLYLLKGLADHSFRQTPIREVAGATQSMIDDFNGDGWPDIMALFAHGDEGIWVFLNDQKGGFTTKNILRFPPVYGSSSCQLVDMNGDGKKDIVYTAGDNSDYSRILKPYHGVYIFLNTSPLSFEQSFFYPINGCTKAIARDFDHDGKIDIVTIAFFADLKNNASESFIYFKRNDDKSGHSLNFIPISIPISNAGRWICMDAADYDGDGDQDIVLGNYSKGLMNQTGFKPQWDTQTPFVVLENTTVK